jgi:hypothetical protein
LNFKRWLAIILGTCLTLPYPLLATNEAACSSSSCSGSGENESFNCDYQAAAHNCANYCGNSLGETIGVSSVYIAAAVVVVAVCAVATVLIVHESHSGDKRHKHRQEEESGSLPDNADLLPSRASLRTAPAI